MKYIVKYIANKIQSFKQKLENDKIDEQDGDLDEIIRKAYEEHNRKEEQYLLEKRIRDRARRQKIYNEFKRD